MSKINQPFVMTSAEYVTLHFSIRGTQSQMDTRCPDSLNLGYTRTMMGFLLFKPQPARIAMIGLGGGSMAKFCYRHLRAADITVIEINPHVIALREQFQVPPDCARFRVIEDDGANFVRTCRDRFDVLLADGYDLGGLPRRLGSRRHYEKCAAILEPDGLLVANLHLDSADYALQVERIGACFGDATLAVEDAAEGHGIVFASRGALRQPVLPPPETLGLDAASRDWADLRAAMLRVAAAHAGQRA